MAGSAEDSADGSNRVLARSCSRRSLISALRLRSRSMVSGAAGPTCPRCGGQWLAESRLVDKLSKMRADPEPIKLVVVIRSGDGLAVGRLPCPHCLQPMTAALFNDVGVDRCGEHGMWFGAGALARALLRSADPGHVNTVEEWA